MKKFMISLVLTVFMFEAFYPAIYATENLLTNELTTNEVQNDENIVEEESVEETEEEEEDIEQEEKSEVEENVVLTNDISTEVVEEETQENEVNEIQITEPQTTNSTNEAIEDTTIITNIEENLGVSYKGAMNLETPQNNQAFTSDTQTIEIRGWAIANDSNVSLKLYINDWLWAEIFDRTGRGDVDAISKEYGGTQATPKAGFIKNLDIRDLKVGKYNLRVDQISSEGKVLSTASKTINIVQKQYKGAMCLETPQNNQTYLLPDTQTVEIRGWAIANDSNVSLKLYINDWLWAEIFDRTERGDVDAI